MAPWPFQIHVQSGSQQIEYISLALLLLIAVNLVVNFSVCKWDLPAWNP